eukprot:gene3264-13288_t
MVDDIRGSSSLPGISARAAPGGPTKNSAKDNVQLPKIGGPTSGAVNAAWLIEEGEGGGRGGLGRNRRERFQHQSKAQARPIRDDSRVGKLISEFGTKDDWVSKTIFKHKMANIIQAPTRTLHAEATLQKRKAEARRKLGVKEP